MESAERFEGDAQYEQYAQLREELSQYSQSLATMCTAYEYLASMSIIVQRNSKCFSHGGELYWPHETLKTGYSSARHRRIALRHLEFMDWIAELQYKPEFLERTLQADAILIRHDKLCSIGWQLRLPKRVEPDFVSVGQYNLMTKKPPELWRLIMLELNSDIFASCQKLVIGSINNGKRQTEETRQEWSTVLQDLRQTDGCAGNAVGWGASDQR